MKKSFLKPDYSEHVENKADARKHILPTEKRPYHPPRITHQGSMVRIALGGSPGVGDSGNVGGEFPP